MKPKDGRNHRQPYNSRRSGESLRITHGHKRIADALVAVYLAGAGYGSPVSLDQMAELAEVPVSSLFGAIQRRNLPQDA